MSDPDPSGSSLLVQILVLVLLTAINAFFASAEMAIVSVNKNKINMMAEEGNKRALMAQALLKEPTKFLSTIQVAITLAGFASAFAATGIAERLGDFFSSYDWPYSYQIALVLITVALSYFTLVFGELVRSELLCKSGVGEFVCGAPCSGSIQNCVSVCETAFRLYTSGVENIWHAP